MLTKETQRLVVEFMPFADSIAANKFKSTPPQIQLDELKSAAYLGLCDAATRYDGKQDFKPLAAIRILGQIKDYLRSLGRSVKARSIPEDYDVEAKAVAPIFEEVLDDVCKKNVSPIAKKIFAMYYGQGLTMAEIAREINLTPARVCQLIKTNTETLRNVA
jgi:RNA polymerase sigma factor (sigma-70 family)